MTQRIISLILILLLLLFFLILVWKSKNKPTDADTSLRSENVEDKNLNEVGNQNDLDFDKKISNFNLIVKKVKNEKEILSKQEQTEN